MPLKQKVFSKLAKDWKRKLDTNPKLTCNGSEIEQITLQKLLGVNLDNHLSFTEHIDDICKKKRCHNVLWC